MVEVVGLGGAGPAPVLVLVLVLVEGAALLLRDDGGDGRGVVPLLAGPTGEPFELPAVDDDTAGELGTPAGLLLLLVVVVPAAEGDEPSELLSTAETLLLADTAVAPLALLTVEVTVEVTVDGLDPPLVVLVLPTTTGTDDDLADTVVGRVFVVLWRARVVVVFGGADGVTVTVTVVVTGVLVAVTVTVCLVGPTVVVVVTVEVSTLDVTVE